MKIKLTASFSRKLNIGNYQTEDYGQTIEIEYEGDGETNLEEWSKKTSKSLFKVVKDDVMAEVEARQKEILDASK